MTDEELAEALWIAHDDAKPMTWVPGLDDDVNTRHTPRVRERWLATVRQVRRRLESSQREQTAAAVLAALIAKGRGIDTTSREATAREAVALADALRSELAKK